MVWLRPAPGTVFVGRLNPNLPIDLWRAICICFTATFFTSGPAFWGVKILDRPVATLFANLSSSASTCYGAVRLKLLSHSLTAPKHNRRLIQQVPSVMRSLQNIPFPKGKSQICRLLRTISGFNQEPGIHGATCKDWKKREAMRC